jgi:hypothetical protein
MPAFSAVAWICDPAGSETSEAPVRLLANAYRVFSKRVSDDCFRQGAVRRTRLGRR